VDISMHGEIKVKTGSRAEMVDITQLVQREVSLKGISEGICVIYVPHTTAGITINEGADPDVCTDIVTQLNKMVPPNAGYRHIEGNSDSHIRASLMGSSVSVIIDRGSLVLGTWQKIFFCEFDGPRSRKVLLKIIS
jgi:secondary thiamine-phosphate synthase enzyme